MNTRITITGVDERTKIADLYEGPEYAVLYSASAASARYPSLSELQRILRELQDAGHATAIHICGNPARHVVLQEPDLLNGVGRIQVNGGVTPATLRSFCETFPDKIIITQNNHSNRKLMTFDEYGNHAVLVDGSGGRGISPETWIRPATEKEVGFAGGLSESNIRRELHYIQEAAGDYPFWIDLESGARDANDWFSVHLTRNILQLLVME